MAPKTVLNSMYRDPSRHKTFVDGLRASDLMERSKSLRAFPACILCTGDTKRRPGKQSCLFAGSVGEKRDEKSLLVPLCCSNYSQLDVQLDQRGTG